MLINASVIHGSSFVAKHDLSYYSYYGNASKSITIQWGILYNCNYYVRLFSCETWSHLFTQRVSERSDRQVLLNLAEIDYWATMLPCI